MPDLMPFSYDGQQIRTVLIADQPWFVLSDVCRVLGLARGAAQVAGRLPDGVRQTYPIVDSLGRTQQATVVNEAGLYRVVLRSDAPAAEPFITWVTDDVLPTIRRTGRYGSDLDMLRNLPSSKMLELAAEAARRAEEAQARVHELEPKATRWDEIAGAEGDFAVDYVANVLTRAGVDIGRNRLFRVMADLGWLFRRGGDWHPYQNATGLVVARVNQPRVVQDSGRLRNIAPTIRITGKGLDRLAQHYGVGEQVRRAMSQEVPA